MSSVSAGPDFRPLPPSQIQGAFQKAQELQRAGQWEASEPVLRAIEASIPRNGAVCASLALNAKQRGDFVAAEALLKEAVSLEPKQPAFLNNFGSLMLSQQRPAEALSLFRAALALDANYLDANFNLGRAWEELQDKDAAIAQFNHVIALAPNDPRAYVRLAACFVHGERFDEALSVTQAAAGQGIETYDLVYFRACALAGLERFDEALAAHRRAHTLAPQRWEARKGIANCLGSLGENDAALEALAELARDFPEQIGIHHEHSTRAWQMDRKDQFLASFAPLRARGAMSQDHYTVATHLLIRAERIPEAIDLMTEAMRTLSVNAELLTMMGTAYSYTPQTDIAANFFEDALRLDPDHALALQNYGFMAARVGAPKTAAPLFERMLARDPKNQLALAGIGLAFRDLGDLRADRLFDFGRFVKTFDLALPPGYSDVASFNEALAAQLDAFHTQKHSPIDQTLRGGTQTQGNLFNRRNGPIGLLQDMLRRAIADYLAALPDDPAHPFLSRKTRDFKFSGSWSCRLKDGGYHTNHVHNMGWISSAYYVQLPPEVRAGSERKQGWISFGQSNLNTGPQDVPQHFVQPVVGRLVLFPSYFWHGTVPFESGTSRMTVAFDAIPA